MANDKEIVDLNERISQLQQDVQRHQEEIETLKKQRADLEGKGQGKPDQAPPKDQDDDDETGEGILCF